MRRLERTAFGGATAFALGISAVCVAAGVALYFGIVAGLGLATPEMKLFEDYYIRPTIEYSGVYEEMQVDDPDQFTSALNDEQEDSNQDAEGGAAERSSSEGGQGTNPLTSLVEQITSFDVDSWTEQFSPINYEQLRIVLPVGAIVVAAALVAAVLLQRRRRELRLRRIASLPPSQQVLSLWGFLESRFGKLGMSRPGTLTPLEYALASRARFAPFARGTGGVDHLALTLMFQRAAYGSGASEEDREAVVRFYRAFFKNARSCVGGLRWLVWFWRL